MPLDPSILNLINDVTGTLQQSRQTATEQPFGIKSEWDPQTGENRYNLTMMESQLKPLIEQLRQYQQMTQGFAAEQFRQAQQVKENPWGHIAATIAGNMAAADPKLPGFVRGLGAASLELNPSAEKLQERGMHFQETGMNALEKGIGLQDRLMSHAAAAEDRKLTREMNAASREHANITRTMSIMETMAKNKNQDVDAYLAVGRANHVPEDQLKPMAEGFAGQAKEAVVREEKVQKWKEENAEANRKSHEAIAASSKAITAARLKLDQDKWSWHQKIAKGEILPLPFLQKQKLEYTKLKAQLENQAIQNAQKAVDSSANTRIKYAGISMFDKDGSLKASTEADVASLRSLGENRIEIATAQLQEVNAIIAGLDEQIAKAQGASGSVQPGTLKIDPDWDKDKKRDEALRKAGEQLKPKLPSAAKKSPDPAGKSPDPAGLF